MDEKSYKENMSAILKKWEDLDFWQRQNLLEKSEVPFVRDGAINFNLWNKAHPKVLFLLKEAYNRDGDYSWDEAAWVAGERCIENSNECPFCKGEETSTVDGRKICLCNHRPKGNTFNPLREWAQLICGDSIDGDVLLQTALLNVKKSGGQSSSSSSELIYNAWNRGALLLEQIKLLEPDYIVCGGTYEAFRIACLSPQKGKIVLPAFQESPSERAQSGRSFNVTIANKWVIIDACHPNARLSANNRNQAMKQALDTASRMKGWVKEEIDYKTAFAELADKLDLDWKIEDLLSQASHNNRFLIEESTVCGCTYCKQAFDSQEITKWTEDKMTALCPYCEKETVIPGCAGEYFTCNFLRAYFERKEVIDY